MTIDGTTITVTPLGATFVPVTQAKAVVTAADMGSNFVQARAADPAGNIDFSDGNFLKKWTAATNSVSTLVNGGTGEISVTPNIALNAAGDVFIADRNASAILKYESATSTLSTIVTAVPKLDPSGVLPDGRQFADSIELKKILLADTDKFAAAFTEKPATYALRRGMTFSDREELKHVAEQSKAADYKLSSLIESLVTSPLFVKR